MELVGCGPEVARDQLRAMTMITRAATSGLEQPQRAMLDAVQEMLLRTEVEVDALAPIGAEELASRLDDPTLARQLVRLMVAISLADGPPSEEQVALISDFASALGVDEPSVKVVRHLARNRVLLFRLAFTRHSHLRIYMRNTYRMLGGLWPTIKAILRFRGVLREDPEMASRFHALAELPEQTLGRRFHDHCKAAGLAFSGEKGGFPPGALFHDFTHVLAGYDTSPEGEMKAAAFQAGFTRDDDDFFTALFAIVIHTAGINMTPFPMPVLLGRIGQGTLARDVLRALQRGSAMKVDLGDGWDFWEDVELPIDVVREKLGIPPLEPDVAPI